jgi:hypothetical protein
MRKDIFTLERREPRALKNLRVRLASRFAALAARTSRSPWNFRRRSQCDGYTARVIAPSSFAV